MNIVTQNKKPGQRLFNRFLKYLNINKEQFFDLMCAGNIKDNILECNISNGKNSGDEPNIEWKIILVGNGIEITRHFCFNDKQPVYIANGGYELPFSWRGKGLGVNALNKQMCVARNLGFLFLECYANRHDETYNNGYYVWASMGFDGFVPTETIAKYMKEYKQHCPITIQEFFREIPNAREFWKTHGESFTGRFNLQSAESAKIFREYYERRQKNATIQEISI